jgi:methanogenic corrinoid protein MtbC1
MRKQKMGIKKNTSPLVSAIADLKEELAIKIVREYIALNHDPIALIAECQEGLRQVGERYEKQKYYLSGLVMGGEIFKEVTELVQSSIKNQEVGESKGKVLIGTVAGDIHDLGKNVAKILLQGNNFSIFDLGVDVHPAIFLQQAKEIKPDIIGLSCLITSAFDSMRVTIKVLRDGGCQVPIIIGGSQLHEAVSKYTGADYWVNNASSGVEICNKLVSLPRG